jgi:hypothetical protein
MSVRERTILSDGEGGGWGWSFSGDESAFAYLVQKYRRPMVGFMYRMCHNPLSRTGLLCPHFPAAYSIARLIPTWLQIEDSSRDKFVGTLRQFAEGGCGGRGSGRLRSPREVRLLLPGGIQVPDKLIRTCRQRTPVPKLYPSFGNAAFFALLATIRISNLRAINTAQ